MEREEFVNVGVILSCPAREFLDARLNVDQARLAAFAPDLDITRVEQHLAAIPLVCRGGEEAGAIGALTARQRFHWLVAPRSAIIQMSPVHSGVSDDPAEALEQLLRTMVLQRR